MKTGCFMNCHDLWPASTLLRAIYRSRAGGLDVGSPSTDIRLRAITNTVTHCFFMVVSTWVMGSEISCLPMSQDGKIGLQE